MASRSTYYNNGSRDVIYRKKRRRFLIKLSLIGGSFLVLCGLTVYALFFSNLFDVRHITMTKPESGSDITDALQSSVDDWLDTKSYGIPRRNNILLLSSQNFASYIQAKFPSIQNVTMTKTSLHELKLDFSERESSAIWCGAGDSYGSDSSSCFYVDSQGVAYATATPSEGYIFITIKDQRRTDVKLGDSVIDPAWIGQILTSRQVLLDGDISANQFLIPSGSFDEFQALTNKGFKVLLNNTTDLKGQINSFLDFSQKKIAPEELLKLQYVDLRIPDRIYYK